MVFRNLDLRSRQLQQVPHLVDGIGSPDGGRRVVPRQAAAERRDACVNQPEMQPAANQIVNHERPPTDSQSFDGERAQFLRLKMMREEGTAHYIERGVAEGQPQAVAAYRRAAAAV